MNKRKNIMSYWKEFNPSATKSIKDDFQPEKYDNMDILVDYLHNGKVSLISTQCGMDVCTDEIIADTYCIMTDGELSWTNTLEYYIKRYNLKIPAEIENIILSKSGILQI